MLTVHKHSDWGGLSVIHGFLLEDDSLEDRTVLSADAIADLLNVCWRSTYFCYKDKFYEQVEGALWDLLFRQ